MKRNSLVVLSLLVVVSMVRASCQAATPTVAPTTAPVPEQPAQTEAPVQPEPTEAPVATEAPTEAPVATEAPTEAPAATTRKGGWLDEIVVSVVAADSAVTQLEAGAIDI